MANKKQYALSTKDTTISIDRVVKLKKFLDSKKTDSAFPSISVFPDMLGSVLSFVNEKSEQNGYSGCAERLSCIQQGSGAASECHEQLYR